MILTYFETAEKVKYYLKEAGVDVEFYGRTDSLFVTDSVEQFFGMTVENTLRFIELLHTATPRGRSERALQSLSTWMPFSLLKAAALRATNGSSRQRATPTSSPAWSAPTTRAILKNCQKRRGK